MTYTAGPAGTTILKCVERHRARIVRSGTKSVEVVAAPVSPITVPSPVTSGAQNLVASVPFQAGATYVWSMTGGTIISGNSTHQITFTAGPSGTIGIQCGVTNLAGTTVTGSQVVTVLPAPSITSFMAAPPVITRGTSTTLTGTFSGGAGTVDNGVGSVTSGIGTMVTLDATTTYALTVVNAAAAVVASSVTVQVVPPPTAVVSVPDLSTTGDTGLMASVAAQPGSLFSWSMTGGTITSGANTNQVTFMAGAPGTAVVQCTVTNAAGTTVVGSKPVAILAAPAITTFTAADSTIRSGMSTTLTGIFSGGTGTLDQGLGAIESGSSVMVSPASTSTYTLTVVNEAGASTSRTLVITVVDPDPNAVAIQPERVYLSPGASYTFQATVGGNSTGGERPLVTWSVSADGGSIVSGYATGGYTAPKVPGTYFVTATSTSDGSRTATATVQVNAPNPLISVAITPSESTTAPGVSQTFQSAVLGTSDQGVAWSSDAWVDGALVPQGPLATFVAPVSGIYRVTATSNADPSKTATAMVYANDIGAPIIGSFSAHPPTVQAGEATTFSWSVSDATTVVLDGTNVTGQTSLVRLPNDFGYDTLIATNPQGNAYRSVKVNVLQPTIESFTADPPKVSRGGSVNLLPVFTNGTGVIDGGVGSVQSGILITVAPNGNTRYLLTVTNEHGAATSQSIFIPVMLPGTLTAVGPMAAPIFGPPTSVQSRDGNVVSVGVTLPDKPLPSISSFSGTSSTVSPNGTLTITPEFQNGTGSINHGIGQVTSGVPITIPAGQTWTFVLTVTNEFGLTTNQSITVSHGVVTGTNAPNGEADWIRLLINRFLPPNGVSSAVIGPGAANFFVSSPNIATLADGRILWGGGEVQSGYFPSPISRQWDIFNPRDNTFQAIPSSEQAVAFSTLTPLRDGRLLLLGGLIGGDARVTTTRGWIFDPDGLRPVLGQATRSPWQALPSVMSNARQAHQADLLPDGRVIISGGYSNTPYGYLDGTNYSDPIVTWPSTVEVFDPVSSAFTTVGDFSDISSSLDPSWADLAGITRARTRQVPLPDGRVLFFGMSYSWVFPLGMFDPATNQITPLRGPRAHVDGLGWLNAQALPNGLVGFLSESAWSNGEGAQYYDPLSKAFYTMEIPAVVSTGAFSPAMGWYDTVQPVFLQDGRILWPETRLDAPGTAFVFTYPYEITINPFQVTTTVDRPVVFTSSSANGDALTWNVSSADASFDPLSGVFTAHQPGTYRLTATDDQGHSAVAVVEVLPTPVLNLTPQSTPVYPGGVAQFSASLSNTPHQIFHWEVLPGGVGGTITEDGVYTAPSIVGTDQVKVTSLEYPELSAQAELTVTPLAVSLAPAYLELNPGGTFTFTGSASFGSLVWSAPGGGTLQPNGTFSAPVTPGTYSVIATSTLDPKVSAMATVLVRPPQILISPNRVVLGASTTYQFQGAATAGSLLWSVVEPGGGAISSSGLYGAPSTPGTYTVKAVSSLSSSVMATAAVIVIGSGGGNGGSGGGSPVTPTMNGVSVQPSLVSIRAGTYQSFNATVFGQDDQTVTWSLLSSNPAWASVDPQQGVFTASHQGTYQVVAVSTANGALVGSAVVMVTSSLDPLKDKVPAALNREGYSVTALPNGKILIAGGWDGVAYRSDCYLYDPATQTFVPTGAMLETKYTVTDDKGQAISMTVSAGRSGHTATLLKDGRVLIANGVGRWTNDAFPPNTSWERLLFAQIYDPASGTFQLLPGPPDLPQIPGWVGARNYHMGGTSLALGNGQALLVGAADADAWNSRATLFDAASGGFSPLVTRGIGLPDLSQPGHYLGVGEDAAVAPLEPGRALILGGWALTDPGFQSLDANFDGSASVYDPQVGFTRVGPMKQKRAAATATPLADGRVLIVGGAATAVAHISGRDFYSPTNTAEIFDPKTSTFTSVAPMKWPRCAHAAILLPTGQVLVVGGYTSQTVNGDGSSVLAYPTETELYDPDSNTWRVMDDLGYGLEDPKLALLPDGSVFVAGQVQAPMETPAALAAMKTNKLMAADVTSSLTTGSSVFGVINSAWREWPPEPEETAMLADPRRPAPAPYVVAMAGGTPLVPTQARISVALPANADSPGGAGSLWLGANERPRYFLLKVQKPSNNFKVTQISVTVQAGAQIQTLLDHQPVASLWDPVCYKLMGARSEIPLVETDPTELSTEQVRKAWALGGTWIPEHSYQVSPDVTNPYCPVDYYRVRISSDLNRPSPLPISYGLISGSVVPPPSDTLVYKFRLYYTVGDNPTVQFRDISVGHPLVRAHWSAAQFFTNSRYGSWNNDKWLLQSVWNWVADAGNREKLEPVNDATLEHGRNTGHHSEHLRGDAFDTFHPGYTDYLDANGNAFNLDQSAADGEGGRFRDILVADLALARNLQDSPQRQQARARLVTWINAARTRIQDIVTSPAPSGHQQSRIIYMVAWQNRAIPPKPTALDALHQNCAQLRELLFTGSCRAYTLSGQAETPGLNLGLPAADFNALDQQDSRFAWDITDTHSHHLHLTFRAPGN